jgi:hypothetical protein
LLTICILIKLLDEEIIIQDNIDTYSITIFLCTLILILNKYLFQLLYIQSCAIYFPYGICFVDREQIIIKGHTPWSPVGGTCKAIVAMM